jgi:hypothetical protein
MTTRIRRPLTVIAFNENGIVRQPYTNKTKSVALVRKQTIPTERPPLVGEVMANFCW